MTPQQIVGLAARLFSIWLAIGAFQAVAIAQALKSSGGQGPTWVPYFFAMLYLAGALLLWLFPMVIGNKLVPRTRFEDKLHLPAEQVVVVACVVLGLMVIFLRALPPIAAYVSLATFWVGGGMPLSRLEGDRHIDGLVGFLQLIVGVLLVTKAHAISGRLLLPTKDIAQDRVSAL
jgi:hypothetical protein